MEKRCLRASLSTFARPRGARAGPGLVTYTTAGDPDLPRSAEILRALDRAGADVLEVGVPFSDPLADGPVIQRATERALAAGGSLRAALALDRASPAVTSRRRSSSSATRTRCCGWGSRRSRGGPPTPAWTACSRSICRSKRPDEFPRDARGRGPRYDLPAEPDDDRRADPEGGRARARVPVRHLAARRDRARAIGSRRAPRRWSRRIRAHTSLPIALGFGISRPEHVAEVGAYADAAVVGSALVSLIAEAGGSPRARRTGRGRTCAWLQAARASGD